jgi:amino acid transporter
MSGKLGLKEVVAMGVGGIIGGGIFAVLGVAARISGNAAFLTYSAAGIIALLSGRSYWHITQKLKEEGGSFTFLEHYFDNHDIAGMVGWILIIGYIGTMAMYAYAFGSFAAGLFGLGAASIFRGIFSVSIITVFIWINYGGVKKTGGSENLLVYGKILILSLFCVAGIYGMLTKPTLNLFQQGIFNKGLISPIVGIGAIFVSFEGFQLLTYEYSEIENPSETIEKGILYSLIISTIIYLLVAFITTGLLTPEQIANHKETVLAFAAAQVFHSPLINQISYFLVSIAALFSTASAINATLFGTARLTHKIAKENELPQLFSFKNKEGIPTHSLLIVGIVTALFTIFGTLEKITTFASVSFVLIFGIVNYLSFKESETRNGRILAGFGVMGTLTALFLLLWHLFNQKLELLIFIAGLFGVLLLLETLYFERKVIEHAAEEVEKEIEKEVEEIKDKEKHL